MSVFWAALWCPLFRSEAEGRVVHVESRRVVAPAVSLRTGAHVLLALLLSLARPLGPPALLKFSAVLD